MLPVHPHSIGSCELKGCVDAWMWAWMGECRLCLPNAKACVQCLFWTSLWAVHWNKYESWAPGELHGEFCWRLRGAVTCDCVAGLPCICYCSLAWRLRLGFEGCVELLPAWRLRCVLQSATEVNPWFCCVEELTWSWSTVCLQYCVKTDIVGIEGFVETAWDNVWCVNGEAVYLHCMLNLHEDQACSAWRRDSIVDW